MTPIAAALIITSAFMHAAWNFLSQRREPSLAFFFVTAVAAAVVSSPMLLLYRQTLPRIPGSVWGLVLATGLAQTVYFLGLAGAYRRGDISLAYPLARALPVIFVAVLSILLGNGGQIGRLGLLGMVLITIGCIILPLRQFSTWRLSHYLDAVYLMACIAAVGTTGYTLVDDLALRQLRLEPSIRLSNGEITLVFIALQTISTATIIGVTVSFLRPERRRLGTLLQTRSLLLSSALTGVIIMVTYGLVLTAMAFVTNVSYVAAFRQLSIPLGALLGLTLQAEPAYQPKLVGIGVISVGLIFVGLG